MLSVKDNKIEQNLSFTDNYTENVNVRTKSEGYEGYFKKK
jgi:hypothetical protein